MPFNNQPSAKAQSKQERALILLQSFATIDEIVSAIILSKFLPHLGFKTQIYLDKTNDIKPLKKYFPFGDINVYSPNGSSDNVALNMQLPRKLNIENVLWKQKNGKLEIQLQLDEEVDFDTEVQVENISSFDRVYMVGDFRLTWIYNYDQLKQTTNLDEMKLYVISNRPLQANQGDHADIKVIAQPSLTESIVEAAGNNPIFDQQTLRLAVLGALDSRRRDENYSPFSSRILELYEGKDTIDYQWPELKPGDKDSLKQILSGEYVSAENVSLLKMLSSREIELSLTTQEEATINQAFSDEGDEKFVISTNLRYRPDQGSDWTFRKTDDVLIGIYQESEKKQISKPKSQAMKQAQTVESAQKDQEDQQGQDNQQDQKHEQVDQQAPKNKHEESKPTVTLPPLRHNPSTPAPNEDELQEI